MKGLRALVVATDFVVFFGMTTLFQGMRGIMRLGGFVATGGPYAIAHPAPTWVWIIPTTLLPMIAMFLVNLFLSGRTGAIPLALPFWSGLFLSLGYNFLEFTFRPPAGMGFPWGWLVCGVVFVLMGGGPLLWAGKITAEILRNTGSYRPDPQPAEPPPFLFVFLQVAAMAAAVVASVYVFRLVSG